MCKRLLTLLLLFSVFVTKASNFEEEAIYHDYVDGQLCFTILDKDEKEAEVSGTTLKVEQEIKKDYTLFRLTIPNSVTIGSVTYKVTTVANGAFRGCSNLESVSFENGITYIGKSAFENCSHLNSVYLPEGVAYIGDDAFSGCVQLPEINLPKSMGFVGKGAFRHCQLLKQLEFSVKVNELDASVFEGCSNLESIWVDENNPNMMSVDGVLYNKVQTTLICCPDARTSALIIPRSVAFVSWPFSVCNLACISCSSENPPIASFSTTESVKVSLFVPKRSVAAYQQDAFWSRFVVRPY